MRFPSPIARLAAVAGLLAVCAPAVPAKPARHHAKPAPARKKLAIVVPMVSDNAPFWTDAPTASQWKTRNERRLQLAQAALDRLLTVNAPHTV